jgi:preprotein translocase subunit SecG
VQRGRSGGLVEALGGVESIFGTKTSAFFVKVTVILSILFFLTSMSLAYLSKERGKSLMEKIKPTVPQPSEESIPQESDQKEVQENIAEEAQSQPVSESSQLTPQQSSFEDEKE